MDCQNLRRYLDLYIDDELDLRDRVDADAHIEGCPSCKGVVGRERSFRLALRGQLRPVSAPDTLRRAILESVSAPEVAAPDWRAALRRGGAWFAPAALAAAIALVVVWPFERTADGQVQASVMPSSPPPQPVAARLRPGMALASLSSMPADVAGAASDISRYMAGRVPFFVMPSLAERDGLRLVGAREVVVNDAHGAMLIYRLGAQRLSVVQTAATADDESAPELVVTRDGRVSTARFVRDGVVHTVVSELDPAALARLVESATRVD